MQRLQVINKLSFLAVTIFLMTFLAFIVKSTVIDYTISKLEVVTDQVQIALETAINNLSDAKKDLESVNRNVDNVIRTLQRENNREHSNLTLFEDIDLIKEYQTLTHITLDSVVKYNRVYKLLVLVSSHSRNSWRRRWIRSLWGNKTIWSEKSWRLVFVTGLEDDDEVMTGLKEEAQKYKDILIEDVIEDFYQLAKKVIIGLTWASHNINFEYLLKADDDIFINIDNAIQFANKNTSPEGYFGNVVVNNLVERVGRYGVSKKEHLADSYSPYCSGGGFLMTKASVSEILPFFDFNRILKIDDAYVGETAMRAGKV